ncbi:MAG TPA: tetratricopeptide repeat protein [Candidatus Sulfotelmatobacter sp.]|jgi:tetratricopeptide (TPR) repeat protein|nr:tetratricopeptide repeat protein [Candidatus Sulfotelmatobacter sp.]
MLLRLSDSFSRALLVIGSLLVALWVSFFGVRSGFAGRVAEGNSTNDLRLAVRLEPGNPEYWYRLGHYQQFNLEQPDIVASVESFQKAVALNPGYTAAWLDLGTAYELDGKTDAAQAAFLRAKQTYPASAEVAWRYGNFLLRQGNLSGAFAELRLAVKSDPSRAGAVFSRAYRADPDIDEILNNLLPPLPGVYIDAIAEAVDSQQLAVAQTMWMRLMKLNPHLEIRQFDKFVEALKSHRDFDAASRVWNQGTSTMNLPPLLRPLDSVLWDPSFESGIRNISFAWFFHSLEEGVHTEFDTTEKLSGKQSLRLTFDGKHNPGGEVACASGVVTPGSKYLFSGWLKTKMITGDQGVRFHLRSFEHNSFQVSSTREIHGTTPWTLIQQDWTAGTGVQIVEVCVSREPSTDPDIHISGDAWVDDVTLVPKATERHRP